MINTKYFCKYKTDRKTVGKPVKIKKNGSGRDFPI